MPVLAGVAGTIASFIWFFPHLGSGIVFGPWQGPLLSDFPVHSQPVLSHWLAQAISFVGKQDAARQLNLLTACFGSISCGMVAAVATMAGKKIVSSFEAGLTGVMAALLLACTPTVTYASTGAGPTTLSLSLALLSVALLLSAHEQARPLVFITLSGLTAGLAAANHPSLGLILIMTAIALPIVLGEEHGLVTAFVCVFLAFGVAISLPVVAAWASGESIHEFFSHALRTPYPTLGDGKPDIDFTRRLSAEFSAPLVLAAAFSTVLLLRHGTRRHALFCAGVFCCMGPLLPALTNQYGAGLGIADSDGPLALALAMTSLGISWGVMALGDYLARWLKTRWVCTATIGLVVVFALVFQGVRGPSRRHDFADVAAQSLISSCPEDAILITGDPDLTSLILAALESGDARPDLTVISTQSLMDQALRKKLLARLGDRVTLNEKLAGLEELDPARSDAPYFFRRLARYYHHAGAGSSDMLLNLALWEFIKDNSSSRPICFAGVALPWLTSRAEASGCVLVYPHHGIASSAPLERLIAQAYDGAARREDPGVSRIIGKILVPLSDGARCQKDLRRAARLAQHAALVDPQDAPARLALARVAARDGKRWAATEYAATYLALMGSPEKTDEVVAVIKADLQRAILDQRFQAYLKEEPARQTDAEERRNITDALWEADELTVLADGYERIIRDAPGDHEALFEYAATLAELGELDRAWRALKDWSLAAQLPANDVADALEKDGRFVLLK